MASDPGAIPAAGIIPLSIPALRGNEWEYVKECLDTNWVSSVGPFVDRFERAMAARTGVRAAVATVNGTAALHVALRVAGIEPDDEVVVPALTFIAPANAVRYVGAWPVFLDVDPVYGQLDPQQLRDFIDRHCDWVGGVLRDRQTGRRVKAVLPVDILGHPADMTAIVDIARSRDLAVVEDATESLGALYYGNPVGRAADIACFSFNGNKIVTSGGGGMIVTDRTDWAARAKYLTEQAKDDPIEYVHHEIGFNYRLTNVLAAIGVAQLEQLDACIEEKRRIAAAYAQSLSHVPGVTTMAEASWATSTYWMYTVRIDAAAFGCDSRAALRWLAKERIQTRPLWEPLHRSRAHAASTPRRAPVADAWNRDALSLPCSVGLSAVDQQRVVAAMRQCAAGTR